MPEAAHGVEAINWVDDPLVLAAVAAVTVVPVDVPVTSPAEDARRLLDNLHPAIYLATHPVFVAVPDSLT
jgi:hypothetical protein